MSNDRVPTPEREEMDLLMPWYATGRLSPEEADRMARAIANDPEMTRLLSLAEEERDETVISAEAVSGPSIRARDALFSKISEIEGSRARGFAGSVARVGLLERLQGFFASLSPRSFALGAGLAALLIVMQAGVITGLMVGPQPGALYGTASKDDRPAATGTFALVGLVPNATVGQLTTLLTERGAVIVGGPTAPGGMFRVRLSETELAPAERDRAIGALRTRSDVVAFVAPTNN